MSNPRILLAVPTYDGRLEMGTALGATLGVSNTDRPVTVTSTKCSILQHGFNVYWCKALNGRGRQGFTHFAMLHADITPDFGWLDILLDELRRHDADLVSAVVPIKDTRGLTSTALSTDDPWCHERLTLTEVFKLPETFCAADARAADRHLLVNTGCWLCRLDRPWCDRVCFQIHSRVVQNEDGVFIPQNIPEDWDFSRQVQEHGGVVLATRKVLLDHMDGCTRYTNRKPWGEWQRDEAF